MYKTINGWTKDRMKAQINKYNNGTKSESNEFCVYETERGNRCAVGCFIPDLHNGLHYRGNVHNLVLKYSDLKRYMPLTIDAMKQLQRVHDRFDKRNSYKDIKQAMYAWIDSAVVDS